MRLALAAALLALAAAPVEARGDDIGWPGQGTIRLAVPPGWELRSAPAGEAGVTFRATPRAPSSLVVKLTVAALPAAKELDPRSMAPALESAVKELIGGSVEKRFDPRPLTVARGQGIYAQFTDAALAGKSFLPPGEHRAVRSALLLPGPGLMAIATILFDDPDQPEVAEAMALVSSLSVERTASGPPVAGPFAFTVPQSRVVVKVPDIGLRPDTGPRQGNAAGPNYFMLQRREPSLILSGWLEPASAYKGLDEFWRSETSTPVYAGAGAPTRVEKLRIGAWEVVAFDVPVPGGTSAHLRAEQVKAGTWVDLHLSSTSGKAATALREELLGVLRQVELAEK